MKAMLMECPRSAGKGGDKSKGHDMCRDKILVKIRMENGKKVVFPSLFDLNWPYLVLVPSTV